jgi:hypothetical protein
MRTGGASQACHSTNRGSADSGSRASYAPTEPGWTSPCRHPVRTEAARHHADEGRTRAPCIRLGAYSRVGVWGLAPSGGQGAAPPEG